METTEKKSAWTDEQESRIAHFQETLGLDRSAAIRRMRTEENAKPQAVVSTPELAAQQKQLDEGVNTRLTGKTKPEVDRAATRKAHQPAMRHAAKPKAKAKKVSSIDKHISPQKQVHIDELVRSTAGKVRAVEAVFKSSLSEKYTRYIWYGCSDGTVLSVNPDTMTARWLDPDSRSVKLWQKAQRAALLREKAAAKKEAK